jgi:menaquinone-dependent protoporphyrinogen IX oxidase
VKKYGITKTEATNEAVVKYIDKYLGKFKFSPVSKAAFGGKVIKKEITRYNNWNRSDIIAWTKELGSMLINN